MDQLRTPLFILAGWALLLAALLEAGYGLASGLIRGSGPDPETPGLAITYLAIIDVLLLHSIGLMALQLFAPRNIVGRLQGPVTLVLAFLGAIAVFVMIMAAFGLLMLTVTLLISVPFGTIAYIAGWGVFAVKPAAATLLILMILKIAFAILLPLAHQRFLEAKGLVALTGASILFTWAIAFLHAFPPGFLVSIVDYAVAMVIAAVGFLWLLFLFFGSFFATISSVRSIP